MSATRAALPEQGTHGGDRVILEPGETYVTTPYIDDIVERALAYLHSGYPVHIAGPSGTGKTTLAFHLAALRGRPVTLVHGNAEFGPSDLVGTDDGGFTRSKLVDNYIRSVMKTREEMRKVWVDNRLTIACRNGYTLLYDEFNRSRPETNNVLLPVLAEGILNLPELRASGEGYLSVHDGFRAVFTSNPEEYAGTHKIPDALADRMITLRLDYPDRQTELNIVSSKSNLEERESGYVVDMVRELRDAHKGKARHSLRASIAIANILARTGGKARYRNRLFHHICYDVLNMETARMQHQHVKAFNKKIDQFIQKICPPVSRTEERVTARGVSTRPHIETATG